MDKLMSLLSALLCLLATAVVVWGAFMSFSTGIIFLGIGFTIFALIFAAMALFFITSRNF